MRHKISISLFAMVAAACGQPAEDSQGPRAAISEIDEAAAAFVSYAHAFDYPAMRAQATADFEILIFGQRLSLNEFIDLLRRMEESRNGRPLSDYALEAPNTEIVGDVAYTSWASSNWLESAILVRVDGRWLIDRAASVRVESAP